MAATTDKPEEILDDIRLLLRLIYKEQCATREVTTRGFATVITGMFNRDVNDVYATLDKHGTDAFNDASPDGAD